MMSMVITPPAFSVRLRPVGDADLPILQRWDLDPSLTALMGKRFDQWSAGEWLKKVSESRCSRAWMIEANGQSVGEVELAQINRREQSAELRICIGEAECRGRGIGRATLAQTLVQAFGPLNLRTIYLRVFTTNEPAIQLYERAGFRREALMAPSARREDPAPVLLMSLSRHRWAAQHQRTGAVELGRAAVDNGPLETL